MRNPEKVLNSLTEHSKDSDYKFERLYRILFNEEMFYLAYQNIYANEGNMTKGVDGETADQMNLVRIERLIESLKSETYQPHPSRRTYIPKKNGKMRPLGIPSFNDKLVQEVIRLILEAIYEGYFEHTSHGFRKKRSCHTASNNIQKTFNGTKWFIEGDIKGFFDNIDHEVLISVLKERIADDRFIRLIRKFLNAGYVENWKYNKSYSGTPQGGIVSPILANIYLDKFDKYMKEYIQNFDKGVKRHRSKEAKQFEWKKSCLTRKLRVEKEENARKELIQEVKKLQKERIKYPHGDVMDETWKRMKYMRYADDFLIGVIGSKEDCVQIKTDITQYMNDVLKLELSTEKTLITNAKKPAKFLGYDIFIRQSDDTQRDSLNNPICVFNNRTVLYLTTEVMRKKLLEYDAVRIINRNGKEVWKPKARKYLNSFELKDIVARYNAEIRGFYNYYSIANNSSVIDSFYNIMEYSMYKTFANKLQSSTRKVIHKFSQNGEFKIPYANKKK
ncbi:Group II intron-encoded protein LtrA [termite gut metagenome]|uniref:Group II intron-encoded protein LtrA n=1 Tax=termite gut metagenome TaxID=433724 RepID=A0A5J4QPS6_9ZZZZ